MIIQYISHRSRRPNPPAVFRRVPGPVYPPDAECTFAESPRPLDADTKKRYMMKLPDLFRRVAINRVENTTNKTSNGFGSDCLKEFRSVHKRENAGRGPVTFMLEFPGPILDGYTEIPNRGNLLKLRDHERGSIGRGHAHGVRRSGRHSSFAA
ncbi:hypothetical protein ASPTUDRAFT_919935 [Aspergillus tubingensis CBS 134.48]|uniref:Uncharacterized protein n=1 Tax=Aspergillus tubingensis (strain CBS 134.48) TaxID=767770 RepID=A0A1L9NHD4_ASPTC|nr:hypothetical protein ASPTUDRAFT_919935 [Aspergillus tubingensis CBS 134.48]